MPPLQAIRVPRGVNLRMKDQQTPTTKDDPASANPVSNHDMDPALESSQEARITRIPPEEWRKVKRERKIDYTRSVLLVSSKANFKTNLRKRWSKTASVPNSTAAVNAAIDAAKRLDVPYRLAINSRYLLSVLAQWVGPELSETNNVLVRPFKYLVFYEQEIRQFYNELEQQVEADCRAATEEQGHNVVNESDEPADGYETPKEAANRSRRERDQFRCLVEFMDRDMADIFDIQRQIADKTLKEITFEHLWQLFRPGNLAYQFSEQDDGSRCQAFQILHVTGGRACFDFGQKCDFDPVRSRDWDTDSETEERCRDIVRSSDNDVTTFLVDCFYVDFDGRRIGPRPKRFAIQRYSGARPIKVLALYPASLHPYDQQIQQQLLARGKRFSELAMGTHKRYDGDTLSESSGTSRHYQRFKIDTAELHTEVIVDQLTGVDHYMKRAYKWSINLGGGVIFFPTESDARETFDPLPQKQDNNWVTEVLDDSKFELDRRAEFVQSSELLSLHYLGNEGFPDACLALLPPRIYGYSLLDHKWFALDINSITDIPPRSLENRFDDLVLPKGHGRLLQALIKNQIRVPRPGSDVTVVEPVSLDVVAGKGKGLIILLHGVPGVGKTSTAECVAAELKRPLLPITCGDIGTTAKEAEETLEEFCALAHKWRCVLLLDEADVFLAKREKGDIERNSLVSVFLRVLEYYSGVIILTTNRVGEFDEAFRSRIHISLYYPKLTRASTKEIWEKNLKRLRESGIDIDVEEDKIRRFIDKHWEQNNDKPSRRWNGRQIKNSFQTAIALARWEFYEDGLSRELERPLLKAKHFHTVAHTSAHFDDYIRDIHGFGEEDDSFSILAGREEVRHDSNPGLVPESATREFAQSMRAQTRMAPGRPGMSSSAFASAQSRQRGFDGLPDDEDEDDDIEIMEQKLKLARLRKKKGLAKMETPKAPTDDEDDELW